MVFNRLNDETERWTNSIDILLHDPLNNRRLSRIVQASVSVSSNMSCPISTCNMSILISLSLSRAFLKIDSIMIFVMNDCLSSANPAKPKARLPLLHLLNAANTAPFQYVALTHTLPSIFSTCAILLAKTISSQLDLRCGPSIALWTASEARLSPRPLPWNRSRKRP